MAKGMAGKIPPIPWGRKLVWPGSGLMLSSRLGSNFPEKMTERKKNARIPRARMLMMTVNRIVILIPM